MENFASEERQWWVKRWLELLDSYRFKKRLERGRNYAREGNVLSIEFAGSQALAAVQGSEAEPYRVAISLEPFPDENRQRVLKTMTQPPFDDEDWQCVIQTLSEKAIFSAQLLAGVMPEDIEAVFTANGLSLFPFTLNDVRSRCSCPDKANPCKHIAAVYYQLGDRFQEDPFIIFQLRGRTREDILDGLRRIRTKNAASLVTEAKEEFKSTKSTETVHNSTQSERFWQYNEPLESSLVAIAPPLENQNVLDLLGRIPLPTADAEAVERYLTQVYQTATQQATMAALNQTSTL